MQIVLVAAIGENNVIGRAGQLPWRLKSDLAHFRALTMNRPLIMGRKTYESIGKPLTGRTNIVLTRDSGLIAPGTVLATTLEEAFAIAQQDAEKRGVDEIMLIGGSDVFADTMARARATRCFRRSTRRSGARSRAKNTPPARMTAPVSRSRHI